MDMLHITNFVPFLICERCLQFGPENQIHGKHIMYNKQTFTDITGIMVNLKKIYKSKLSEMWHTHKEWIQQHNLLFC